MDLLWPSIPHINMKAAEESSINKRALVGDMLILLAEKLKMQWRVSKRDFCGYRRESRGADGTKPHKKLGRNKMTRKECA